jgi:hypothetical protein
MPQIQPASRATVKKIESVAQPSALPTDKLPTGGMKK